MVDRLQNIGSNRNGYFSQAAAEYAARMKPEEKWEEGKPKTIGEFSKEEWERKNEQYEEQVRLDNGSFRTMRFMRIDSMGAGISKLPEQPDIKDTIDDMVAEEAIQKLLGKGKRAPYSLMADEKGIVEYKGVEFRCDYEHNRLCLGDVSNPKDCITVGLEKGGSLVFNRNNIDDLVRAIDMFSPEDINRIMRAIAEDAKLRQIKMQIEDETSGLEVLGKPEDEESEVVDKAEEESGEMADKPEESEEYESERQTEQPNL